MKTRIYGRFSSKPQEKGDSYRRQTEGAIAFARKHGLDLVEGQDGIYFDEGVSGKAGANLEKNFGRILADSKDGDCILCEFLDRIGRQNPFILGKLLYDTVQKGITVIAWAEGRTITKENIDHLDTMFSVFTGTAIGFSDNERKIKRSNEINEASYRNAVKGIPSRNIVKFLPTSYTWNETTNQIEFHEDKAKIIRRIFDEFTSGFGKTVICQHLNKENVPTIYAKNKTKKWLETSVSKILRNEAYAGVASIKGNRISCFKGIVSQEQFNRTQVLLERYKKRFGKQGDKVRINNLFRNIAVCADCGGHLQVNCSQPYDRRHVTCYTYRCRNSKLGKCDTKKMRSSTNIELFFFAHFFGGDGSQYLTKDNQDLIFKRDSLIQQIEKKEVAISNLYDMAESGDKTAGERIALRRSEKQKLEQELRLVKNSMVEVGFVPTMANTISDLFIDGEDTTALVKQFYPNIRKKLEDNETRRKLSVLLPSMYQKLVVNLRGNSFYAIEKNGLQTQTINVDDELNELKADGVPFK